jgi:DNA-binding IscR family transcriptional regulator
MSTGTCKEVMTEEGSDNDSRRQYPLSAFVDAVEAEGGMAGTQAVADRVGCSYELAYKRLNELKDAGQIESKRVGNAHLWRTT